VLDPFARQHPFCSKPAKSTSDLKTCADEFSRLRAEFSGRRVEHSSRGDAFIGSRVQSRGVSSQALRLCPSIESAGGSIVPHEYLFVRAGGVPTPFQEKLHRQHDSAGYGAQLTVLLAPLTFPVANMTGRRCFANLPSHDVTSRHPAPNTPHVGRIALRATPAALLDRTAAPLRSFDDTRASDGLTARGVEQTTSAALWFVPRIDRAASANDRTAAARHRTTVVDHRPRFSALCTDPTRRGDKTIANALPQASLRRR
jgi:hypothetical protein